jgi:signal transduction histidine kinase
MTRVFAFLLLLGLHGRLCATDQALLDSMKRTLRFSTDTAVRLNALYTLSFEYGLIEPGLGIQYGKACLELARLANKPLAEYNAYNGMSNAYETLADFDSARWCNMQSFAIAKRIRRPDMMALALTNVAISYKEQGDYRKALDHFLEGYRILEKQEGYNLRIHFYIGEMLMRIGDYAQAEYHSRLGLKRIREGGHSLYVACNLSVNLAKCLLHRSQTDSALVLLNESLAELKKNTDQLSLALCLRTLGETHATQHKYRQAADVFAQELAAQQQLKNENGICLAYLNLASVLVKAGGKKARIVPLLNEAEARLESIRRNKDILRSAYEKLAETYELMAEPAKALGFFRLSAALSDSLLNGEKVRQLGELQVKYETSKKEQQILEQRSEIEMQRARVEQKRLQLATVVAVFAALALLGLFFYYRYRSRQNLAFMLEVQRLEKQQEQALEEKEKQERDRISRDIHDELGSGLSKIALLAEFTRQQLKGGSGAEEPLGVIARTAKQLGENMRDLVWALSPDNSSLDHLAARMHEYGSEYFEELQMRARFDFPEEVPAFKMPRLAQRNLFLTFKEAMNNCVKHAQASEFSVRLRVDESRLSLSFCDNGHGFEKKEPRRSGNGLRNMEQRIRQIGGLIAIESGPGGTSINILLELPATVKN